MIVPALLRRLCAPTVLLRVQCLQILSNAISSVVLTDSDRDEVPKLLGVDAQVLDAVLTLYATGHDHRSVESLALPYRLTDDEWAYLLTRAAFYSLSTTAKGLRDV